RTFHSIGHKLCESMVRWGVLQSRQLVREGWPYEKLVRQGITQALPNADQATRRKALDKDHLEAFMQFAERVKADLETPKDQFRLLGLPDDQRYFIEAFEQLEQIMAREGVMTFSDLLYRPAMAILARPELEARISNHLDHVIVDEYQDINSIQQFLL
ncbi:UvrD-helicase domain-containing protein, partial [Oceanospirillum sp. HFRX-1_2]